MSRLFKSLFGQMCRFRCEGRKKGKSKTSSWQGDQAHFSWRRGFRASVDGININIDHMWGLSSDLENCSTGDDPENSQAVI